MEPDRELSLKICPTCHNILYEGVCYNVDCASNLITADSVQKMEQEKEPTEG